MRVPWIDGVAAKIRGATAAGCHLVLLPADNFEQVVDAMVYEGPSLITDVQIIGVSTLDEAAAAARTDRAEKLNQAIDEFGSMALVLKKTPECVHSKEMQQKLQRILDLAPNHFSAKLLLLVAQNRQPRTLSAAASMYYAGMAIHDALPVLFEQAQSGVRQSVTPTVVQEGMINLRKLRSRVDPKVLPLVDAMNDFIWTLNAINSGRRNPLELESKRQHILDALTKLNADRALMEEMLHEGV